MTSTEPKVVPTSLENQPRFPGPSTTPEITGKDSLDPETNGNTLADKPVTSAQSEKIDIEHVPVLDDPRSWSNTRKNIILALVSSASFLAGLAASIQNPAIADMEQRLNASAPQISLSISLFIIIQGNMPLFWSAVGEIKGRRAVYIVSIFIFCVGSVVVAVSNTIQLVIGFRCLQAAGSSAVLTIGAGTLADIYEPYERGTKMGIYYIAPSLGPALGPIFGGSLTTGFDWRAVFYFMGIISGTSLALFVIFFKDTFRRERSVSYQRAVKKRLAEREAERLESASQNTVINSPSVNEKSRGTGGATGETDVEAQPPASEFQEVKLTFRDISPFEPIWLVIKRKNNLFTLTCSGVMFAFNFVVVYATARTLSSPNHPYQYNALKIGLVLLAFGMGSIVGSLLGGKWSDRVLAKLKEANGGKSEAEMRLQSTNLGLLMFPPSIISFGWALNQNVHIGIICFLLFLCGFFVVWTYSSTLAYIVDANVGRSSTAIALNSSFRGMAAFIATEITVPVQDSIGDGWMYTVWFFVLVLAELLIVLVIWKGAKWRAEAIAKEEKAS